MVPETEDTFSILKPRTYLHSRSIVSPPLPLNLTRKGSDTQPVMECKFDEHPVGTLWDGIVPLPYAPIMWVDPPSFDDEYLGPMPWVTKADMEVEESQYYHENADDKDDFF
ncbi:hypothetical protein FRC02_003826 [Tulasnella sp. 418]|nr:hypothetical protein FRC02_003826 [Tulasnella sp. 418]